MSFKLRTSKNITWFQKHGPEVEAHHWNQNIYTCVAVKFELTCSQPSGWKVYARCRKARPAYGKHSLSRCRSVQHGHQEQASADSFCSRSVEWCLQQQSNQVKIIGSFAVHSMNNFTSITLNHLGYFWRLWWLRRLGCRWCTVLCVECVCDSSFCPYQHACAERRRPKSRSVLI